MVWRWTLRFWRLSSVSRSGLGVTFFEPQTEFGEDTPQMHGTGPYALLGGFLPQLHQNDVRLRLDQPPDQLGIDAAGSAALRHPLVAAALTLDGSDLQHPAVADIEPISQLSHRAFASRIGRQNLTPKIIAICSRHLLTISQAEEPAKNLALYPRVIWSSYHLLLALSRQAGLSHEGMESNFKHPSIITFMGRT